MLCFYRFYAPLETLVQLISSAKFTITVTDTALSKVRLAFLSILVGFTEVIRARLNISRVISKSNIDEDDRQCSI